jgi:hypothetical protein
MKPLDPTAATDVNGGHLSPPLEELPYVEPLPVKEPRIDVDYNPLPLPQ